jgi:MYXO-CTERM domain-containing protein
MSRFIQLVSLAAVLALFCAGTAQAATLGLDVVAPATTADPHPTNSWANVHTSSSDTLLDFTATLTNLGDSVVYLNGLSVTGLSSEITLDSMPFLLNFPVSLDAGETETAVLFTITVPGGTSVGSYTWSIELTGGADALAGDSLASADGGVTVNSASTTATPEPGSLTAVAGLALLAVLSRRRHS